MTYRHVDYKVINRVAVIRLNDPDTLNAMTLAMAHELFEALKQAEDEARSILLCAAGAGFCSGANLADATFDLADPERDVGESLEEITNPILLQMRASAIPIVCAVQGPVVGVGCGLALASDLIVAGEQAYFYEVFSKIGLVPDGGATYLLAQAIGRARAMELMLLGSRLPAAQALDWGLINRVVPDAQVEEAALSIAEDMARGPASLGMIRKLAWAALDSGFDAALIAERTAQRNAGRTDDFLEGVAAFREKRKPAFRGQ
ncbi:MAG: enoyl-CoA hydratase-related protein [Sphingobium sp.]